MLFLLGHFIPQKFGNQLCSDMASYPRRTNASKYIFCTFRQQMEREALKQKHQNEIAAFHHQQQLIQQLKMKSSKFQALQQIPSSPTVSAPAAAAMYPITYQSVTPTYTGNSALFVPP